LITFTEKGAEKVQEFLDSQSADIQTSGLRVGVRGAIVDYVEGLQGAGFKVDNPNVIAACGCGSSFRVAEEEEVSAV
jgi:iron-sulfur cluster assembly protein